MKSHKRKRIVFGIDEGLPSRVAASILRNQDFDLLAVHLHCDLAAIGEDPATYPTAMRSSDLPRIEKFCESLGIPLKCVDVTGEVIAKVYTPFWIATLNGSRFAASSAWVREIVVPHLDSIARARGADGLATGHFARRAPDLYRFSESEFDQCRSLARIGRETLAKLVLPVGDVSVEMLTRLAREIAGTDKEEAPFDRGRELQSLLKDRSARGRWAWTEAQLADPRVQSRAAGDYFRSGPVSGTSEFAVGDHRGIPFFSVGAKAPGNPGYYVKEALPQSRTLVVATEANLAVHTLYVHGLHWLEPRDKAHLRRRVVIEKECGIPRTEKVGPDRASGWLLEYPGGLAEIRLDSPLFALGSGEELVFFEESRVLGTALLVEAHRSESQEKAIENPAPQA